MNVEGHLLRFFTTRFILKRILDVLKNEKFGFSILLTL